jgi:hypothetical protein
MEPVSRELVTKEVVSANPLRPWLLTSVSGMLGAALAPQLWMRVPMMLLGAYMLVQAILVYRGRRVETNRVVDEREAQLEDDLAAARAAHEAEEEDRAHQHEQEELLRARLRNAEGQDDVEIVALALEIELSNEDLPIPVVYEVEFDGVRRVTIQLDLPTLEDIPPTRSRVTKSGTFSERPMALRDRISLYQDVCAGLALRLVHEVYRVLPFMQSVELTGVAERLSPATGHPERYPALRLATTRGRLLTINLDDVDPSQALQGLGGQLTTTREGVLKAVDPEHG